MEVRVTTTPLQYDEQQRGARESAGDASRHETPADGLFAHLGGGVHRRVPTGPDSVHVASPPTQFGAIPMGVDFACGKWLAQIDRGAGQTVTQRR
jgi:hypothetical protein